MAILLVQVPVSAVSIDEVRFPARDRHILEHLVQYCAKFEPLPAIGIVIEGEQVLVTRGHIYVTVAEQLGRPTIQAVVTSPPSSADVQQFLARPDVSILDWETIRAREDEERNPKGWHVYFFERPLSGAAKARFGALVRDLFGDAAVQVHHDDVKAMAEFEACTPVTDEAWIRRSVIELVEFSREYQRIVSYQGARFPR